MFKSLLFSLSLGLSLCCAAPSTSPQFPADGENYARFKVAQPPLLPMPQDVTWSNKAVKLSSVQLKIGSMKGRNLEQMKLIHQELSNYLNNHHVAVGAKGSYPIQFQLDPSKSPQGATEDWQQAEAYSIKADAKGCLITASSSKGFFYAMKTLQQLIMRREGATSIALCHITDWPDLQVRGFMNDVGRNFLPLDLIKLELDAMAALKFNVYHFHLTDHYGWRLGSKKYPALNKAENHSRSQGQYYTQEEFKELVEYCRLRNITIIPELDMPGHSDAFRKAIGVKMMSEPKATEALVALIKELGELASVEDMPTIHIGTDEVRNNAERVNNATLNAYYKAVEDTGRKAIHWSPGLCTPEYRDKAIEQMWIGVERASARPRKGGEYIDSQDSYVNHADPFECGPLYYFRRPCPYKDAKALGFILCSWPDLEITDPRNHLRQTAVFPAMAFVSQAIWNNPHPELTTTYQKDEYLKYFGNIPAKGTELHKAFAAYEDRVLAIRDRFFKDKEFPYVRQAHVSWKIIGPFPHGGDVEKTFPVEEILEGKQPQDSYTVDGKEYKWLADEATGHTVLFKDFRGNPTLFSPDFHKNPNNTTYYALQYIYSPKDQNVHFWIGAQHWPSSDRNAGGPPSVKGEWHLSKPRFYLNGKAIPAPDWKSRSTSGFFPLTDENYFYREPTELKLKKGWNQVLIKSPCKANPRRWMFTFAPIKPTSKEFGIGIREFPGLKFATSPEDAK